MSQATVVRILAIESEATKIRDDAIAQAAQMIAEFEREASRTRAQTLEEARVQANSIAQEAQRASETTRAEALAQAGADGGEMEERAAHRLDAAVQYILDQITRRA